jgi:hypothetical protein
MSYAVLLVFSVCSTPSGKAAELAGGAALTFLFSSFHSPSYSLRLRPCPGHRPRRPSCEGRCCPCRPPLLPDTRRLHVTKSDQRPFVGLPTVPSHPALNSLTESVRNGRTSRAKAMLESRRLAS